jgi:hypothetical protein
MSQTPTVSIRIPRSLHTRLTEYAASRDTSIVGAIGQSLTLAQREQFWAAVETTMCSPDAVGENRAEAGAMDPGLAEGLDDESDYWLRVLK